MSNPAEEIKQDVLSTVGLEDFFEPTGTAPAEMTGTAGTIEYFDPGQPGHETIDASDITNYISTSDAARLVGVDSRTVRRWYDAKKVRGQFNKGKLLIAKEDLIIGPEHSEETDAGAPRTESGTEQGTAGTPPTVNPGQPPDISQSPVIAFADFLDRIERLSRENGELRALLEQERSKTEQLRLLTDNSQSESSVWMRLWSWMGGK